jgi:hypothetical protein
VNKDSILLITFYYPPYPKVGSRRWVKFAKYLYREKKDIHILTVRINADKKSPWDEDAAEIEHITSRIHFKSKVPYYKRKLPDSLASRVKWHGSKLFNSIKKVRPSLGCPLDDSEIYAKKFISRAKEIILQKNIATVIFTGSPFHLAYHISELKNDFPSVRFIFDLRDYWADWMGHLNASQLQYEIELERKTITNSDLILCPAQKIIDTLKEKYPEKRDFFYLLPHAYDEDDFSDITNTVTLKKDGDITLVYGGTMYPQMDENMHLLATLLKENKHIILKFYTFTKDYSNFFSDEEIKSRVTYVSPLPMKEFVKTVIGEADGMLYMRSKLSNDNNFLSSKFFDFLPLKKPVIYLGEEGDASKFIVANKIGFHLESANLPGFEKELEASKEKLKGFDSSQYSFSHLSRELIAYITK